MTNLRWIVALIAVSPCPDVGHARFGRADVLPAEAVLNRGAGKPRDYSNEQTNRVDLSVLSPEEREALAGAFCARPWATGRTLGYLS